MTATVAYDAASHLATLTPSAALQPGATYTLTIVGGISGVADSGGNTLAANVTSSFTTLAASPAVLSVTPTNATSGVDVGSTIRVQFNKAMNAATINSNTLQLSSGLGTQAAVVNYVSATNTATITPTSPLANSTTYSVTVVGGAGG